MDANTIYGLLGILVGAVAGSVVPEVIRSITTRRKNSADVDKLRAEADAIDLQTFNAMRLQLKGLVQDNADLHKEIEFLRTDNRNFRKAYARAILYIHEKNPGEEPPDFFIETQPLRDPTK